MDSGVKMTEFFVRTSIFLVICVIIQSLAQSIEAISKRQSSCSLPLSEYLKLLTPCNNCHWIITAGTDGFTCSSRHKGDYNEPSSNQDDAGTSDGNDIDRIGSLAYPSITQHRPVYGQVAPVKLVNCYACVDCPKALANTTSKYCPYTNDPTKTNKCVVYGEKYTQLKKLWYVRGCASERGTCADIKRGHDNTPSVKLTFCDECEGDRCNTSGVSCSTSDLTTALLFLILCPVLGKYTVS